MPDKITPLLVFFIALILFAPAPAQAGNEDGWLEITLASSENLLDTARYSGGIFFFSEQDLDPVQVYYRGGVSTLVAFDNNADNDYFGIEGAVGLKVGRALSFLTGIGVMLGQTNQCEFTVNQNEECVDRSVEGLIPEVGVRLTLGDAFFVSAFARKYILSGAEDNFLARGISFGFGF